MPGLPLAFAAPAVLIALAALAALWWFLRVTPPRPREEVFPPLRLLLGLVEKTPTPAKTPWPLLALRLLVAAAVVLAMAGPIWNAIVARAGAGSLLVILDDSWAAAPTWGARVIAAREAMRAATQAGRLVALAPVSAGGEEVRYNYDPHGRLATIESPVGKVTFEYDVLGRRSAMLYPNGVRTTYAYDKLNRLTELRAAGGDGAEICRYRYAYDILGNRTSMTEGADKVTQYGYDALSRLTKVTQGTNVTEYAYDGVGNRVSVVANGVKETYATGKDNQLLAAGKAAFQYDADGNMVARSTGDGAAYTYTYDAANRMVAAAGPAGKATYGYAPNGKRVSRAEAGQPETRFIFDQEDMIAEQTGNTKSATYLHGPGIDAPLAQRRGDATSFYQADGLGSITALTDAKGTPVGRYTYDAFGVTRQSEGTPLNPYRFTAREWDATADSYFYRARSFDPAIGIFLSKDPLGLTQGQNVYLYCANNPTLFSDPSGCRFLTRLRGFAQIALGVGDIVLSAAKVTASLVEFPTFLIAANEYVNSINDASKLFEAGYDNMTDGSDVARTMNDYESVIDRGLPNNSLLGTLNSTLTIAGIFDFSPTESVETFTEGAPTLYGRIETVKTWYEGWQLFTIPTDLPKAFESNVHYMDEINGQISSGNGSYRGDTDGVTSADSRTVPKSTSTTTSGGSPLPTPGPSIRVGPSGSADGGVGGGGGGVR